VDCGGFFPGYLCHHDPANQIQHIDHVDSADQCQRYCQTNPECNFFSHYLSAGTHEHIGHCFLLRDCSWLEGDRCTTSAAHCPYIPPLDGSESGPDVNDAREEFDPEDEKVNVIAAKDVVLDSDDLGPASGECGCMAGPKYPSIDTCDY